MDADELRFKHVLMDAVAQCQRLRYNPTRFVQMIQTRGAFEAVRTLLDAPGVSDGFGTLMMKGRLDLTVEHIATRPEWRHHFTAEQLARARERLAATK